MPIPTLAAALSGQGTPAPAAPVPPQSPVVAGVEAAPQSLEALRVQSASLSGQLSGLEAQRRALLSELRATGNRPALAETRAQLNQIDAQIAQVATDLGSVRAQIAVRQAEAIRTVPPPYYYGRSRGLNGDQVAAMGIVFMFVTFLPISVALARRIWRRQASAPRVDDTVGPRFDRLEHAIDAIAIEVERISEGQRFVTRVLAERPVQQPARGAAGGADAALGEGPAVRALGAGPAEPIRMPEREVVRPSITPH